MAITTNKTNLNNMGLQTDKTKWNVNFPEAYTRISKVRTEQSIDENGDKIIKGEVIAQIYADKAARDANSDSLEVHRINMDFDKDSTDNFYHQAYNHLKTLPEWTGAVDILEA